MMRQDHLLDAMLINSPDSYVSILHLLMWGFLLFLLFSFVFCGVNYLLIPEEL